MIRGLVLAVILMTVADAGLTVLGVSLGVITEANPLLKSAVQKSPLLTGISVVIYTVAVLSVIWKLGPHYKVTIPLLIALTAIKTTVVAMHLYWISML